MRLKNRKLDKMAKKTTADDAVKSVINGAAKAKKTTVCHVYVLSDTTVPFHGSNIRLLSGTTISEPWDELIYAAKSSRQLKLIEIEVKETDNA